VAKGGAAGGNTARTESGMVMGRPSGGVRRPKGRLSVRDPATPQRKGWVGSREAQEGGRSPEYPSVISWRRPQNQETACVHATSSKVAPEGEGGHVGLPTDSGGLAPWHG